MKVTRRWLQEWVDLSDISTQEIVEKLNSLGLEVAEVEKIQLPAKIVLGEVLSCQAHPNADKLSVCEVDIGKERLQIVCGAKNAKDARYVAVATIGAQLSNTMTIAPVKLRGVESYGMLCSSTELGLPKMEDGIMLLDESIGEIALGKELREFDLFDDEIIDIELTANRGDCLSVLGVARELASAFGKSIKKNEVEEDNSIKIGIGRLLNFNVASDIEASLLYQAFEAKNFTNPFLIRLRLALIGEEFCNEAEAFGYYLTHSTGVITRLYGYDFFKSGEPQIRLKKDEHGYDALYGKEKGSIVGVVQYEKSKPDESEEKFIVQMGYIDPELIAKKMFEHPVKSDWEYYRSSRGSEPRIEIGVAYMKYLLKRYYPQVSLYSGRHEVIKEREQEAIKIDFEFVERLIGQKIERNSIVEILKSLEFHIINVTDEAMIIKTPPFRHDIKNVYDVVEEIVRIYGIDNITPLPLVVREQNRFNASYEKFKKKKLLRTLAVGNGFYETISFVFTSKKRLKTFGFEVVKEKLELLNPITKELDTLRTTLVLNLLEQCERNIKNGKKIVKLFEIGPIFDQNREQNEAFALIHSGQKEVETITNQGRPEAVDFASFVKELSGIIGDFELVACKPQNALMHPYQSAKVIQRGKKVGVVYKLTLPIQEELDLAATYIAEFDFNAIDTVYPKAKPFSIYQLSFKDLSILVDKAVTFEDVKQALGSLPKEVKRFYPIDIYEDEKLGEKKSMTLRFALQSDERTLTEEELSEIMQNILKELQKIGATLR